MKNEKKKERLLKTEKIIKIIETLKKEYQNWQTPIITLIASQENDPFKILISTILSARTKDTLTSEVTKKLFKTIKKPEDLANKKVTEIEKLIYPIGFYKRKAIQIKKTAESIIKKHNGKIPDTLEELIKLDGVGRKTANLVLIEAFKKDAICVDTHVHRISNRLRIVQTENTLETELKLMERIPKKYWKEINKIFVSFGQTICLPVKPKCENCKIKQDCQYYKKNKTN